MKAKILIPLILFLIPFMAMAQQSDTTKLPFAIADEKRMSDEDLQNKKQGVYVTGAPDLSSDPINGFGYGVEGSLFFNGKRSDPFFAYTPYRAKLDFIVFNTTKETREFFLRADVPYIFNTKWRFRIEGGYEQNPNLLYFGVDEKSLKGLSYYPNGDSSKAPVTDAKFKDYEANALIGENEFYNGYLKKEGVLNISMERILMQGKMRVLLGYEAAYVNMTPFAGNSLILNDSKNNGVLGLQKSWVHILQVGLIYDTRDLEPDPSNGEFIELTNELSLKSVASAYTFNKTFFNAKLYRRVLPDVFGRLIFAGRLAMGYTAFDAPFFEYQDQWSSEGSIEGLGGATTLRGYKQSRFLSRLVNFTNLELRWRFAQTKLANQHFAFSAVPFYDLGGVWDSTINFDNLRYSEGLGLRVAWNVNTILRFDYAVSKEDSQFFFNLSHAF